MRTVSGSTASTFSIFCRYTLYEDGLLGTLPTRSSVNTTSADVNGEPSENLTPGRSLKVQVLPLAVHDCARQGLGTRSASAQTIASNSVCDNWMLGVSAWYCGSIEVGSVLSATTRSRAWTPKVAPPSAAAAVAARSDWRQRMLDKIPRISRSPECWDGTAAAASAMARRHESHGA